MFVAFLYGEVVKDALFDVFEAVVVALQDFFGAGDVVLAAAAFGPGVVNHPFEVVADDVGLGRHRRHLFEFVQFGQRLFFGIGTHAGVFDGFFQLFDVVERVFHFAQFFLDGFDLFVEVVLALVALHLLFDAAADFAVQVGFFQFFFEEDEDVLQAVVERGAVEDGDAPLQAEVHVRRDGVGDATGVVQLAQVLEQVVGVFVVFFEETGELFDGGFAHRPLFVGGGSACRAVVTVARLQVGLVFLPCDDFDAAQAFNQHFDGAVGEFCHLYDAADGADRVQVGDFRVADAGVFLRDKQQFLLVVVGDVERGDGFFPADKERHDDVRVNDDVAQRQDGEGVFLHQVLLPVQADFL